MLRPGIFCAAVTALLAGGAVAQDRQSALEELAPTGKLRVAIGVGPAASASWAVKDPTTGEPRGVTVDLGKALAAKLGVPLAFVLYASSGEVIEAAATGAWDVAFTPVDAERKQKVDFAPDYYLSTSTFLVPAGSLIQTIGDVDRPGVRVFGVENTATIRTARRALKNTTVTGTQGAFEILDLLRDGKADAAALGRESLQGLAAQLPGARILEGHFHAAGTAPAVPKGKPAALAYVTEFLEEAKRDGTVRRALDNAGFKNGAVAPAGSRS
jgi:polar amino acid transport system substrate-binding protein